MVKTTIVSILIVLAAMACAASEAPKADFLTPCDIPGVKQKAKCGTYEVWENRDARRGRRIGLKVVVLPATGAPREPDAITFLGGGPGEAATTMASFLVSMFGTLHQHRDIVLVDQRGTGGSHALDCDLYPGKDPQTALGAFFPLDRVRACRTELEKIADLRMYTTAPSMDDLDEVRGALGYDRLDVFGGSYGTRAALVFIRRHPDHVRVAVLQGVDPASDAAPLRFPQYAQHAIERIFADCDADASCRAAFPDLAGDLKKIVARTSANAVPVEILDPSTGDPVHVSLSRNLLGEGLRYLMYESSTALFVPVLVHQAAEGDFAPLAEFALGMRQQLVNGVGGDGLYLSVTCSEDLPFITTAAAERAASGTFLGDYRYRDQRAACDAWVRGPIPAGFRKAVHAQTPVLLVSGTWDPVTPTSNAEQVAAALPHSLSIVIPAGGHDYEGLQGADDCVAAISGQVVTRGTTAGIDTACLHNVHRQPFPTKRVETKVVSLTPEQQSALAGHYTGEGVPPLEISVEGGKLIGHAVPRPPIILMPLSPTRLRILGDIGSDLDFTMENGKASGVTLEESGSKAFSWKRQ
jgi:pimeloyl-ACP methyl ester carboxylesterase